MAEPQDVIDSLSMSSLQQGLCEDPGAASLGSVPLTAEVTRCAQESVPGQSGSCSERAGAEAGAWCSTKKGKGKKVSGAAEAPRGAAGLASAQVR